MDRKTSPEPSWRRWPPTLVVHAVLVLILVVAPPLMGPETPEALFGLFAAADLLLGMPWWLLFGFLDLVPVPLNVVVESVVFSLPLLLNLGIHTLVLRSVRARRRRVAEGGGGSTPARRGRPGFVLGLVAGALTWGVWLGWDRTPSHDVVTGTIQTPYVTLQVLGCALTVGTVTAILAARWHPVAAAAGVSVGFWLVWTGDAASQDETGLFAVGAIMLAFGLAAGTSVAAALAAGVRSAIDARRTAGET